MKKIIYKPTGDVHRHTKQFPILAFRSRERNKVIYIGNTPVEVSDKEYDVLKNGKNGKDIQLVSKKTKLSNPMEHCPGIIPEAPEEAEEEKEEDESTE